MTPFALLRCSRFVVVDRFYIALFSTLEQTHCSHVILHEWVAFYSAFLNIHQNGVLTALTWPAILLLMKNITEQKTFLFQLVSWKVWSHGNGHLSICLAYYSLYY